MVRQDLSGIAKDFGNSLINKYEELAEKINEDRCENLRLQLEIASLIKERNSLRHEIKELFAQTKRLEVLLGVTPDEKFEKDNNDVYKPKLVLPKISDKTKK